MSSMKYIKQYELYEGAATPNPAAVKSRIKNKIEKVLFQESSYSGTETKKWLKSKFDIDIQPLLNKIRDFEIEAVSSQLNNILSGVKGLEFSKYVDMKVKAIIKEYVKQAFETGPAKGKAKWIKGKYAFSGGKDGLDKEIISLYKGGELKEGPKELISDLIACVSGLGNAVSQAIRLKPDSGSDEIPEMTQYSKLIRKWADDYDKGFANDEATLIAYIKTATTPIWEV
jgi:hypothetical protein